MYDVLVIGQGAAGLAAAISAAESAPQARVAVMDRMPQAQAGGNTRFGGLSTDLEARVCGQHGPIPGLYAAGEITGHFHASAPNAVAVMRALVFGRIAGRHAIQMATQS